MKDNDQFQAELFKIRLKFLEKLKAELPKTETFFSKLNDDPVSLMEVEETKSMFHKLAGSGKTFGFPGISEISAKVERALENLQDPQQQGDRTNIFAELRALFPQFFAQAKQILNSGPSAALATQFQAASGNNTQNQYKIFVVDDDDLVNDLLKHSLGKEGCEVTALENGFEVFEKLKTQIPDLIILDVMMPDINGLEVMQKLKANPKYEKIPVIFLSKRDSDKDILSGFASGAITYITKPFKVDELAKKAFDIIKAQHIKIMLIDDDEALVDAIEKKLFREGFIISKCFHGKGALHIIEKQKPDLIVLDIMLPGMDGVTILKKLRKTTNINGTPVVILTGKAEDDIFEKCREHGALECIAKPIELDALIEKIKTVVQQLKK